MYQLFLWRLYLMVLRGATSLLGALEGVGPENLDFFGNDVAPLKTITYRAIKTTGTLIVNVFQHWLKTVALKGCFTEQGAYFI